MCLLLKLHYAKFNVSRLFCSKVIEEKPLGGRLETPLGKGRVNDSKLYELKESSLLISTINFLGGTARF